MYFFFFYVFTAMNILNTLHYFQEIRANITSTTPRFTVSTLLPGGTYTLLMYAFNSKGRSDPTVLSAAMLKMPEKQLTSEPGTMRMKLVLNLL